MTGFWGVKTPREWQEKGRKAAIWSNEVHATDSIFPNRYSRFFLFNRDYCARDFRLDYAERRVRKITVVINQFLWNRFLRDRAIRACSTAIRYSRSIRIERGISSRRGNTAEMEPAWKKNSRNYPCCARKDMLSWNLVFVRFGHCRREPRSRRNCRAMLAPAKPLF